MLIHKKDNVEVDPASGHKIARCSIAEGQPIIKYGNPIGHATCPIEKGQAVHTHNMATNLDQKLTYEYHPDFTPLFPINTDRTFMGYRRSDGQVGIRNEIWVVNTVGCVNKIARALCEKTGAFCFEHPFGCSQLGDDHRMTQTILKSLVNHPNAGGVLVLGLGCENNNIAEFQKVLGEVDPQRVKFLNCQDEEDELAKGVELIGELQQYAATFERTPIPISELRLGLKCGGSDGLSGITANPLVGRLSDRLIAMGGSCVLTEVPEMFGAEHLLMQRCVDRQVFDKTVDLINNFKDYFIRHGQVVYENPSPGNKAGGITTLEEKSLGCVQKGGLAPVVDVLQPGQPLQKNGLSLLNGPGNDIVAITNLVSTGVHMVLFTTGRGTPLGGPVPTVKISTNANLARKKKNWIDFDASPLLDGQDLTDRLLDYLVEVAEGRQTANEKNGYREISIFKDGITL